MTLAHRKAHLILPESSTPKGWPALWSYPGANPPGWPREIMPKGHYFIARYDVVLRVECFDEFAEPTDSIAGQHLLITASADTDPVCRVRQVGGDAWSRKALVEIQPLGDGHYGIDVPLEFERDRLAGAPLRIRVEIFGDESGAKAEVMA